MIARSEQPHHPIVFGSAAREDMRHAGFARAREAPELPAGKRSLLAPHAR